MTREHETDLTAELEVALKKKKASLTEQIKKASAETSTIAAKPPPIQKQESELEKMMRERKERMQQSKTQTPTSPTKPKPKPPISDKPVVPSAAILTPSSIGRGRGGTAVYAQPKPVWKKPASSAAGPKPWSPKPWSPQPKSTPAMPVKPPLVEKVVLNKANVKKMKQTLPDWAKNSKQSKFNEDIFAIG